MVDKKRKIKVLILTPNLRISNGVASFIMNYYRRIDHDHIRMDFALYKDVESPYYKEIQNNGDKVFILPRVKNIRNHIKDCLRILSEEQYDIIHDNTLLISYPMMRLAYNLKIPVRILHSHGTQFGETQFKEYRNQFFAPLLKNCANRFVACCEAAGEVLFPGRSFAVLPNVISSERFQYDVEIRQQLREALGVKNEIIILMVARKTRVKNPFFAVDMLDYLSHEGYPVQCWWIGTGPLDRDVEAYIRKKGLSDIFRLLGNQTDVERYYSGGDVFFLPSYSEGLPISLLEAQAMGLPAVVSDAVTKEASYTDLPVYISLSDPMSVWEESFRRQFERISNRRGYTQELNMSKFSDLNAGNRIEALYEAFLKENDHV